MTCLPVPEFLQKLIGNSVPAALALYGSCALPFLIAMLVCWLVLGYGPRRRRAMKRARLALKNGAWEDAIERIRKLRNFGMPSKNWQHTFDEFEAECQQVVAQKALDDGDFEQALQHSVAAAHLRGRDDLEVRVGIQSAMLAEVRRLFAVKHSADTQDIRDMIARTMLIQSSCREASFWQALCDVREGHTDEALVNLQIARTGQARALPADEGPDIATPDAAPPPTSPFIDPPLYLGAIHLAQGQPKEAMRYVERISELLGLRVSLVSVGPDREQSIAL